MRPSDLPLGIQVVLVLFALACIVGAIWAAVKHKNSPTDWDYRDDL